MLDGSSDSVAFGAASSSGMASVTPDGSATPLPPAADAATVTLLSGASVVLATAVTVTDPVLVVAPAAIVSDEPVRVKSACIAGDTAVVVTVSVTASLDTPDSVAVTVDTPPFSRIEVADSTSAAVGVASSSVSVRVAFGGFATLLPPAAVPETVTDLFGESTVLPFAVTVTVPALAVAPAAMVRVVAVLRVKSPDAAPVPAAAATVTVTAALDGPDRVAVTVEIPPVSVIESGASASATVGSASLSVRASDAPVTDPVPWPLARLAVTVAERPAVPWWIVSSTAVTTTVSEAAVVAPAAIVIVASAPTV